MDRKDSRKRHPLPQQMGLLGRNPFPRLVTMRSTSRESSPPPQTERALKCLFTHEGAAHQSQGVSDLFKK